MFRGRRGQEIFGMSYGVIFSIILIIAVIATGFLVIRHFLGLSECTQIGSFYNELQVKVDGCWNSGICKDNLKELGNKLPQKIEFVCFGDIDNVGSSKDNELKNSIKRMNFEPDMNIFIYPPEKACDGELFEYKLKHAEISGFYCSEPKKLETIKLNKEISDRIVKITT